MVIQVTINSISDETIMRDCNKLFNVLTYEKTDAKRVDECLKILYRIVMLMSNNYDTKRRAIFVINTVAFKFVINYFLL